MEDTTGKNLHLNLGCGRNYKNGFINIDIDERCKVDLVLDLTQEWPFDHSSCEFIYGEHVIEHLDWRSGKDLLSNCFASLYEGGTLRLVLPNFGKIFHAYVTNDRKFFRPFLTP